MASEAQLRSERLSPRAFAIERAPQTPFPDAVAEVGVPFAGSEEWVAHLGLRRDELEEPLEELSDALEGTFGALAKRALARFGALEHAVIAAASSPVDDTTVYPFRAVASLRIEVGNGRAFRGTAYFVSPRTLVTAGHNVFLDGDWVDHVIVMPGRKGTSLPFGRAVSTRFHSVEGWTEGGDPDYDYGAIQLDEPIGNAVGWFGLREPANGEFPGTPYSVAGYPDNYGTQVLGWGEVQNPGPLRLYYDIPTATGQSGGPVYRAGDAYAVAVHAYYSGKYNSGVRITQPVRAAIEGWKQ